MTDHEQAARERLAAAYERDGFSQIAGLIRAGFCIPNDAPSIRALTTLLADMEAERKALVEALERISALTPNRAAAFTANDLHASVKAIADTALDAALTPTKEH